MAAKLTVEAYGDNCEVVYCDTMSAEHPDNARFFLDVEKWLGRKITIIKSDKWTSVDDLFNRGSYMSGIKGARCTTDMKKVPREAFQRVNDIHIFGYTADEQKRADRFEERNPSLKVEWILIDKGISKQDCLRILKDARIDIPMMYALGFKNNNCLGCVKATSPKYWNRIRVLFPDVFERRARQSRRLGVRLARVRGERVFLDELPSDDATGENEDIDCGPVCQKAEDS